MKGVPKADVDRNLLQSWGTFCGVDEVGRGALAGPVAVGLVTVDDKCGKPPAGVADSKVLRPASRAKLVRPIHAWAASCAIGWACPTEISELGLTQALRLAALRGLALTYTILSRRGRGPIGGILLDGRHDYLSASIPTLFGQQDLNVLDPWAGAEAGPPVATMVKADAHSQTVAAASIIAKVARDRYMQEVADPGYGWSSNSGYGSKAHLAALRSIGPSRRHRLAWNLPTTDGPLASA